MLLNPIKRSIHVPLAVEAAFDLFVHRLPEWWPLRTRSVGLERARSCHVEPRVEGRLYETSVTGEESEWGRFRVVERPKRAVFSWHPGAPRETATEVEVRFSATGKKSTRVDLEHRGWERLGERASFVHGLFEGGWSPVLARFEALARGETILPEVLGPGCVVRD